MLARLTAEERERGVIAYSSGNHAQGVALAARMFGVSAVVVMPTTASSVKRQGAEELGAEVILEGTSSVERQSRAEAEAEARGLTIIPAFDHLDIIAGQGTVGVEILEDWPDVDTIVIPVGGGGLVSGVAAWVKQHRPECRIIGVEPEAADAMKQSVSAGQPVSIQLGRSVADGLMPVRPGDLTFAHVNEFVDDIVLVSDEAILEATRLLMKRSKLVVEFSGAATVAAILSGAVSTGPRCVAILSGGNLDAVRALELMAEQTTAAATA
jgi:threonine dehydratase